MSGRETFETFEVFRDMPWKFSGLTDDAVLAYGGDESELHR